MLRPNFDPKVVKDGDVLRVSGPGDDAPEMTIVSRSVALQQPASEPTQVIAGAAPTSSKWTAELNCAGDPEAVPPRPQIQFVTGEPVLATGTETYYLGDPANPHTPATFVTVTWSEVLELEDD